MSKKFVFNLPFPTEREVRDAVLSSMSFPDESNATNTNTNTNTNYNYNYDIKQPNHVYGSDYVTMGLMNHFRLYSWVSSVNGLMGMKRCPDPKVGIEVKNWDAKGFDNIYGAYMPDYMKSAFETAYKLVSGFFKAAGHKNVYKKIDWVMGLDSHMRDTSDYDGVLDGSKSSGLYSDFANYVSHQAKVNVLLGLGKTKTNTHSTVVALTSMNQLGVVIRDKICKEKKILLKNNM